MKKKKLLSLITAAAIAVSFTACGSSSDSSSLSSVSSSASVSSEISSTTSSSEVSETTESASKTSPESETSDGDLTEIDIVLDWYPNAIHTFLYYAIDNGYFAEEGLEVNPISPADSVDAINFVASGNAEIGLTYPIEVVQSIESGMPVKALASACQLSLGCMVSLASNEDITSDMTTLEGKTVGYSGSTSSEAIIRTIAGNAGLSDDDYELINVGFDLVTSLTTGSVDIVDGIFINDEVVTMQNAGYDLNIYTYSDYGFPELYGLVMAVNSDSYDADPELYEGFLRACEKGFEDMKADEDAAVELIMSEMNSDDNPLDEDQQRESYQILMEKMETEDEPFLSMSEERWQEIIDWMSESDLVETDITPSDVTV